MRQRLLLIAFSLISAIAMSTPVCGDEIPLEEVLFHLERHAGNGDRPVYSVTIYGSGVVEFAGKERVAHIGSAEGYIPPREIGALVNTFLAANFFSAPPQYEYKETVYGGENGGLVLKREGREVLLATLSFKLGKREHTVYLYNNASRDFKDLAIEIDEVARTIRWVKGQ